MWGGGEGGDDGCLLQDLDLCVTVYTLQQGEEGEGQWQFMAKHRAHHNTIDSEPTALHATLNGESFSFVQYKYGPVAPSIVHGF